MTKEWRERARTPMRRSDGGISIYLVIKFSKNIVLALGFMLVLVAIKKKLQKEKSSRRQVQQFLSCVMCGLEMRVPAARPP